MEQYISKSALVAEIDRQQRKLYILGHSDEVELRKNGAIQNGVYCNLLSFLETLEVKEVDLENEIDEHWNEWAKRDGFNFIEFAKHFFELGLKTQKGE